MTRMAYIVHVWRISKANPGTQIGERDVKRLEDAGLADWGDRCTLTTDAMTRRLAGMMHNRITAGVPWSKEGMAK